MNEKRKYDKNQLLHTSMRYTIMYLHGNGSIIYPSIGTYVWPSTLLAMQQIGQNILDNLTLRDHV